MSVMVLTRVKRMLVLVMARHRMVVITVMIVMVVMVKMLVMLRRHSQLLPATCHRTTRTPNAFFVPFTNESSKISPNDVFGSSNWIIGAGRRAGTVVETAVQAACRPSWINQFTVKSTTESALIGFGHGCNGGEFPSHRIMTEGSLNNSRRIIRSGTAAIFAFQ